MPTISLLLLLFSFADSKIFLHFGYQKPNKSTFSTQTNTKNRILKSKLNHRVTEMRGRKKDSSQLFCLNTIIFTANYFTANYILKILLKKNSKKLPNKQQNEIDFEFF